jgi:hypothetical protein
MKLIKKITLLLFALVISIIAQQKEDYSKYPGYFNYKEFAQLKNAESLTEVYLEEPLLKMVAGMAGNKQEGLGEAIGGLKLVRVNEFRIPKSEITNVESLIGSMDNSLQSKNWERIIRTNSKNDYTNVYLKKEADDGFVGLTIISLNRLLKKEDNSDEFGKATFVNIVGKIDLTTIGKVSAQLKVPGLGDSKKDK